MISIALNRFLLHKKECYAPVKSQKYKYFSPSSRTRQRITPLPLQRVPIKSQRNWRIGHRIQSCAAWRHAWNVQTRQRIGRAGAGVFCWSRRFHIGRDETWKGADAQREDCVELLTIQRWTARRFQRQPSDDPHVQQEWNGSVGHRLLWNGA